MKKKNITKSNSVKITLKNDEIIVGKIIREEVNVIYIKTIYGYTLKIETSDIKKREE